MPLRLDVTDPDAISAAAKTAFWGLTNALRLELAGRILDALEDGQDEAIADDVSAQVKSILPGVTTGVIPQ